MSRSSGRITKNVQWCARFPATDSNDEVQFPGYLAKEASLEFRIGRVCRLGDAGVEWRIRDWRNVKSCEPDLYLINKDVLESGETGRQPQILAQITAI